MRLTLLSSVLTLLLVVLGNATPTRPVTRRQMTRSELVARAKYPEFFGRRRRIAPRQSTEGDAVPVVDEGGDSVTVPDVVVDAPDEPLATQAPVDCPSQRRRRRDIQDKFETPLSARDAAAFLLGHGEFTWDNGTTYQDEHYIEILSKASINYPRWYHRTYNTIRDAVGNQYLEVTIPAFQKFMRHWADGELVWLSDNTAVRAGDIPKIGPILLEHPEFDSIQVHGWKVSRKFVEVLGTV